MLFDPLTPPDGIEKLAEERETAIVLTCPWHRREAEALANRHRAPLYVPPPDEGEGSEPGRRDRLQRRRRAGGRCRGAPGMEPTDLVLWVESHRALATMGR